MKSSYQKTVLDNGLKVITEKLKDRRSVHPGLHLLWGSRNEKAPNFGMAHLIEHMVFKGTSKRSAYEIVYDIESVGAEISAATGKEFTSYTIQALGKDIELCVDILSDITLNSRFSEEELLKEKQVVLSEIAMGKENLEEMVFDYAFEKIFENQPLGRPITGTEDSVLGISLKDITEAYRTIYRPENFVFTASGDLNHDEVVNFCKKYFKTERSDFKEKCKTEQKEKFNSFTDFYKKDSEQSHILINFPAPCYDSHERMAAYFVNIALGGGMTSLLFQKIREDLGIAYSIYSLLQCFISEGVLSIYLATKPNHSMLAFSSVLTLLEKLCKTGFTEAQFKLFKSQLLGEVLLGDDDLENRMNSLAVNELIYGEHKSTDEVVAEINQLTLADVNDYLKNYIDTEPGVVILGSQQDE